MSTKTNLRERICAAVLAFAMIVVSVLPNVALVAQAEEGDAYFFVYEEYVPDPVNAPAEVVKKPVKGATLQIGVESYTTDENGKCIVSGAEDGAGIAISRTGYSYNEGMSGTLIVQAGTTEESPQEIKLEMNDISLSADELILVKGTKDNFISFAEGTKIEDANDLDYTWSAADESSSEKVDVNPFTGNITAKETGNAIIEVARNSKTATKEITIKEQPVLTASVSPIERGDDAPTTDVNVTVNGIPEGGEAVISATFVSGTATTEPKTVSSISNTATFTIPEGKHQVLFTARYAGNEEQFYLPAEVTTELYTYKINKAISVADDFLTEYTYGDPAIALANKVIGADGRNVSFTVTEGDGVLIIDADNTLEIVGAGTAKVTITAAGNDDYNEATADCSITVKKKELGAIKVGDIVWSSAAKVYDGNNDISLTGCLTSGHGLRENDSIVITAKAQIKKEDGTDGTDAGEYTTFDYVSAEIPESANYSFDLDETDREGLTLSNDGKIVIAPRNLYIEVTGDTPCIQYGKTNKELEETLQKKAEIQLVSENGAVEEDINSGLLVGETVDITEAVTVALKDKDTLTYYVNNYQDVIQPVVIENKENLGNYKLVVGNPIENYSGDLSITCQVVEDSDYFSMVQIEDGQDGVYKTDSEVWVLNGTDLRISVASNSMYTDVYMKRTEDESYQENKISLSTEEKGNIKVTDIAVYLSNQNDLSKRTRTTGNAESETATDNTLPETIIIDNELPVVQFDGLGVFGNANNWSGDLFYKKFTNAAYTQTVALTDDGSGIPKDENGNAKYDYKLYAVTADTAGTGEAIRTAAISDEGWTSSSANKINVPANTEGYYVILVRAKDNVGNQAVYCSNGIVVDVTSPTSVTIEGLDKDKAYNTEQEYTITAVDAFSRINKIVVEVRDKDNNLVVGSAETGTDSFTVDNQVLSGDKGLTKDQLESVENTYTLNAKISGTDGISKVKVTVYDTAGNKLDSDEQELNVDINPPTAVYSFDNNEYESVGDKNYFKENRTMTITYTERNFDPEKAGFTIKVDGTSYEADLKNWPAELADLGVILDSYHDEDDSQHDADEYTDDRNLEYRIQFGVDGAEHEYEIESMFIVDGAGNSGTITGSEGTVTDFVIDRKAPTIEISYDLTDADAKNQDQTLYGAKRTMTVTYTEKYFGDEYVMLKLKPETEKTLADWLGATEEGITVEKDNDNSTDDKHVYKVTFGGENLDIDYEVSTSISDYAGNQNSEITYKDGEAVDKSKENFVVDMKAPVVTVQYQAVGENGSEEYNETFTVNPGSERVYKNKTIQAVVTIEERHFAEENAEEVKAEVEEEAFDVANATVNDITDQEGPAKTASNWTPVDDEPDTYTQTFRFSEDANYRFNFAFTDVAGNKTYMAGSEEERYYFTVDKTPPTVTINEKTGLLDRIFEFFSNEESIKYTVQMSDSTSPITGGYNKRYSAQNETGKIEPAEVENLNWTTLVNKENQPVTTLPSKLSQECTFAVGLNEQIVPYVKVEDNAGNITYVNANGAVCETTAPDSIEIVDADGNALVNNTLYGEDVQFSIKVTDPESEDQDQNKVYSGLKEVHYQVLCDGAVPTGGIDVTVNAYYDSSFKSDLRKQIYESGPITIPANLYNSNDVKIKVTVIDNAENQSEKVVPIKIDVTDPEVTVAYNSVEGAGPVNGIYFRANRVMTITYKERNIKEDGLTFDFSAKNSETKIEEKGITLAELKKKAKEAGLEFSEVNDSQSEEKDATQWKDDRIYTYTITFTGGTAEDMDYTITPYIEDEAGHKSYENDVGVKELISKLNHYPDTNVDANNAFTIDKVKPELVEIKYELVDNDDNVTSDPDTGIEKSTEKESRVYTNKTVRATVTIKERNFRLNSSEFSNELVQTYTVIDWTDYNGTRISQSDDSILNSADKWQETGNTDEYRCSVDFEEEGDYEFDFDYVDLAGNTFENAEEQYARHYFTVDKTVPVVTIKYLDNQGNQIVPGTEDTERIYRQKDIQAVITITERNFKRNNGFAEQQLNMSVQASELGSGVKTEYADGNEIKEYYSAFAQNTDKWIAGENYVKTQIFTFKPDANYSLEFSYEDLAGNEGHTTLDTSGDAHEIRYFTVDETPPSGGIVVPNSDVSKGGSWSELLIDIFYNFFTGKEHTSTMSSNDDTSGVAGTYYYIDNSITSCNKEVGKSWENLDKLDENKWTPYSEGVTVSPNSQSVLYEKVVDKAGNVTYVNARFGIIADNKTPTVELTDKSPARNGIHSGDVTVGVTVTDPPDEEGVYAGINRVEYTIVSTGNTTDNTIKSKSETVLMTYTNSEKERNLTGTGDFIVRADEFNSNDVTVRVTAYDNAGNSYEKELHLKIDNTTPEVHFDWNPSGSPHGEYYNTTRVLTVTVQERNFDEREVNWNIDTIEGPYPTISDWSPTGDSASDGYTHTCTVEFAADGVYTVSMNCIDLAGNQSNTESEGRFVIDKTAPIINVTFDNNNSANGKYYNASRTATITINEHNFNGTEVQTAITSNSVTPGVNGWGSSGDIRTATVPFTTDGAYSFTVNYIDLAGNPATVYNVDEFVVDLTKPEIEIFDIIDKSANNGEVAPGVRYSDTNYDVNGVSITYSGPKHKTKAVDGTRTSIPNGESIKMDDFPHTQETDDVYTMVAKVTDLAGNSDEKEVTFSVNRFGSNFIFSKETEEFLDGYYNNEEENLVVTEINVDTLTHRGITCGHDGEMTDFKEGTDYTVKESGGEVSWKSYEYTIKKENFEKEGLYNITIDSVDRATNEVNNKIKEAEIEFVIDKTAPTVVITGVEDDGQYRTNERDIMVSAADNVAVDLVEVYVDDAEKPAESYDTKTIQNQKGELPYTLTSSSDWQKVKVVAVDMAGNITDTSRPEGSDNEEWLSVLVTSNIFVQFYRNTVLVIGTAVVLAGLLGGSIFLILAKRRKKDEEEQA